MFYRVNIHELYSFIETTVSEQSDFVFTDDLCEDNSSYEINTEKSKIKVLDKPIKLLFDLEKSFEDKGFYQSTEDAFLSVNNTELDDDYIVSAQVDSKLDLVRTLNGQYVLNLNFSPLENKFTGIIEKTDEYIIYVINADVVSGNRVAKTGVFYITVLDTNETTAYYFPKFYNKTSLINDFYYKDESTYKWATNQDVFSQVFIDRGDIVSPSGEHESMQLINNLSDISFFV